MAAAQAPTQDVAAPMDAYLAAWQMLDRFCGSVLVAQGVAVGGTHEGLLKSPFEIRQHLLVHGARGGGGLATV